MKGLSGRWQARPQGPPAALPPPPLLPPGAAGASAALIKYDGCEGVQCLLIVAQRATSSETLLPTVPLDTGADSERPLRLPHDPQHAMVRPQEGGPQPEAAAGHQSVWERVKRGYLRETSVQVRALDAYLLFCMAIGALQVVYLICTAGRAYQSFLAGFIAAVGSFVLTSMLHPSLRSLASPSAPSHAC